jgi:hypothetical protein
MSMALRLIKIYIPVATFILLGFFFTVNSDIASGIKTNIKDFVITLAPLCAGALTFITGTAAALSGVMVTVALLPPKNWWETKKAKRAVVFVFILWLFLLVLFFAVILFRAYK